MPEIGSTDFTKVHITGDGKIFWDKVSSNDKYLLEMRVSNDAYPRFRIRADGQIEWGSGSSSPSMSLSYYNSNTLELLFHLRLISRFLMCIFPMPIYTIFIGLVEGEIYPRFGISCAGNLNWGDGSGGYDITMYRRSNGVLNMNGRLEVDSLGFGNAADGSTLGNVVKKIEIFDNAGNSLGYLPVYDSIT